MRDFRELKVWERAHQLTLDVHRVTASFPKSERYGLTSQIRRAASSVPANIAEVEYHLLLSRDLQLLTEAEYGSLGTEVTELKRMLATFIKTIRS